MSKKKPVEPYSKSPFITELAIDSHAHLDYPSLNLEEILPSMNRDGLSKIVTIATGLNSLLRVEQILARSNNVYFALGLHPYDSLEFNNNFITALKNCKQKHPKEMVAIGEIGLDLHGQTPSLKQQEQVFVQQLVLAKELELPVILHIRDAHNLAITLLNQNKHLLKKGGVVHCFSGTKEDAQAYLNLGLYISFTGAVTYAKPDEKGEQVELFRSIPLDKIMIETDCPYLSPAPYRGKTNSPKMTLVVAEYIANALNMDVNDFIKATRQNTEKLFNI